MVPSLRTLICADFHCIMDELKKFGFSKSEIEGMMGGNVRDFMLRNLP
jgi:microsomal dipeptidase-like Zn-dependent dipeptidase